MDEQVKRFRKKPVIIEAQKYIGSKSRVQSFVPIDICKWVVVDDNEELYIRTLEGDHHASIGDYIIKGVKGEFYPCKPEIFEMTYEKVDETVEKESYENCIDGCKTIIDADCPRCDNLVDKSIAEKYQARIKELEEAIKDSEDLSTVSYFVGSQHAKDRIEELEKEVAKQISWTKQHQRSVELSLEREHKLESQNKKLLKSMEEIANGHLYEKVSEMIARQCLEEIKK